ncbi:MAG TPA: proline iminopeptidase-family hydrolase [Chryseosolibacter sp.]
MSRSLRLVHCVAIAFCVLVFEACNRKPEVERKQGFVEVPGGKIWYEVIGAEKKKTPLLLLHGGPGFTSDYLRPLAALANERPVIFYDQLGAGRSDRPQDTSLWNIDRFVTELELLCEHLKLDTLHLFGHSWGTMLTTQYLTKSPKGIKTLILAGPCLNAQQWIKDTNLLRSQLPQAIQDSLKWHEDKGTTSSPGYIQATDEFYKRYFCRIPFTPDVQKSFDEQSLSVYNTMWGNNEFTATGNLKNFNRTDVLHTISVPTLFTCGRFDEATPATTQAYAAQVKNSEVVVIEDASHQSMNEKPDEYVKVVREFLGRNER